MMKQTMWLDNASRDALDAFWRFCGETEPFPRDLERAMALALPVALVKLPRLHLLGIEDWLRRRGIPFRFECASRAVRGCLLAFEGKGWIFVDGSDPDDERRLTLAHEVAHFLLDYWQPRLQAIQRLGNGIIEVLDGYRPPQIGERVYALLGSIPIGVQMSLMDRGASSPDVWRIEDRADRLALALLAPPEEVFARVEPLAADFESRCEETTLVLTERFGLPRSVALAYARALLDAIGKGPSWVEHFRRLSNPQNSWGSNLPSVERNGK
jgi:hypothetical protein